MKLRILLVGLMIALGSSAARATTYTALSSAESAVAIEVALTVNGDTVQIPCSPSTSVWTLPLIVTKSITITGLGATPNSGAATTGSGTNCLTIVDDNPTGTIFDFTPTYSSSNNLTVLEDMNIDPDPSAGTLYDPVWIIGTCTSNGCPNFRGDNIWFGLGSPWGQELYGSQSEAAFLVENAFGVLDHDTVCTSSAVCVGPADFEMLNASLGYYLGVGQYGDNSWAQPDSLGGANNIFVENNLLWKGGYYAISDTEESDTFTDRGGARIVVRYNTMHATGTSATFGIFQNHGMDSGGRTRGGREAEVYDNTYYCAVTGTGCAGLDGGMRSGAGLFFGNQFIFSGGSAGSSTNLNLSIYRNAGSWNAPFGFCGGGNDSGADGAYDQNDGVVYYSGTATAGGTLTLTDTSKSFTNLVPSGSPYSVYDVTQGWYSEVVSNTSTTITVLAATNSSHAPFTGFNSGDSYEVLRATVCGDQPARGQGSYVSGNTPSPTGWLGEALDPIYRWADTYSGGTPSQPGIYANANKRLIANRDWYDQASGVQTSPTSPFNGTSGTGWGVVANRPTTCSVQVGYFATDVGTQGTLYECLTTNTWTAAYTPYTYPHPLDTGGNSQTSVDPPATVNATVNN